MLLAALAAHASLGLFGSKKEVEDLQAEVDKLKASLQKQEGKADENRKKVDKLTEQLDAARKEADELKVRNRELKDQARKGQRLDRDFGEKEQDLLRRVESKDAVLRQVQEEYQAFRQKQAAVTEESRALTDKARKLEAEVAQLKRTIEIKDEERTREKERESQRPPRAEKPVAAEPDRSEVEGLRKKVGELKMALQVNEAEVRVLRRKAEHNRRAYTVTMLQLDLAHDELYFLKTGKIRRETQQARAAVPQGPGAPAPQAESPLDADTEEHSPAAAAEENNDSFLSPDDLPDVVEEHEDLGLVDTLTEPRAKDNKPD
jgi:chromosome segregation ATPase